MVDERPSAIGLIQLNLVCGAEIDLGRLAAEHGLRLAYTVRVDASPLVVAMAVARHVAEFGAVAVVVPGFAHADPVRHVVTDVAALVTPMAVYPRGFRWIAPAAEEEL
ncbi:MAG TPA: hypothetical protein VK083_15810 [Nocardia sp.]|uniref:hypothetical protein n=1 Tax=Nocardia TaxID=1817 RepID=UPI0024567ABE|nr:MULTISPECIES: hypothetical protein [Nocardia]HLS78248.1 hypothetical protein [Nocardia sp.]